MKYQLSEYLAAFNLMTASNYRFLKPENPLSLKRLLSAAEYKLEQYIENPYIFNVSGLLTFHGSQGYGKTLTAAAVYSHQLLDAYPYCILCTNTAFKDRPFNAYIHYQPYTREELTELYEDVKNARAQAYFEEKAKEFEQDFYEIEYPEYTKEQYVASRLQFCFFNQVNDFEDFCQETKFTLRDIVTDEIITSEKIREGKFKKVTVEYWGLDCLKFLNNGLYGVLFFIDEIQLEFNSLDRNIPVEIMTEVCQQRKQRKHIVGTSQRFKRAAKFLREQTHDAVNCRCFFGLIQWNSLIDGESIDENSSGKLVYRTKKHYLFFHDAEMYKYYDTFAKMRRYKNEWQGKEAMIVASNVA